MKRETWFNNEIPQGWEVTRLKNVIISVKNGIWGDEPLNNSDDIECVRIADFDRKKNIVKDKEFTLRNVPKIQSENYLLKKGDLLIEKSGGGEKQPVGFVVQYNLDKKAVYANFMAKIELNSQKVDSTFMNYVFSSLYAVKANIKAFNQTTGIQNLNTSVYLNEVFMYPSLKVQKDIVNFLNKKTRTIDETINIKQKLVDLLEKQRQSIITEAVTKGLNPNVKMKDSGVEWIGEIPEHWEKLRIKNVASISGRIGFRGYTTQDIVDEGNGAITLSPSNIQNGMMHYDKVTYISWEKYFESPEIMLNEDYLIFCKTGSSYGKVAILKELYEPMTINPQLVVIKPCSILPDYLYYVLESDLGKVQVELIVGGGTMPTINQEDIIKIIVTFPPYEEQKQIVEFLNNKIEEILTTITDIKLQINKLKEYRQSLIYEAVTGKIDVREMEREVSEVSKDGCGYVREGI